MSLTLCTLSAAGHPFVAQAMAQRQGMSPFSKLQADMVRVQAAVPATALAEDFDREAWQQQVQAAEQVVQLRQALAVLEGALSEEWLSPLFQRTPRHHQGLRNAWCPSHAQLLAGCLGDRPICPLQSSSRGRQPSIACSPASGLDSSGK